MGVALWYCVFYSVLVPSGPRSPAMLNGAFDSALLRQPRRLL